MYEQYYHFRDKPFRLSPDPRFFFNSSGHKRALAYLRYGVRQGEGFIIITGDVGTGKSMLVQALLNALASENVVAAQIVTTQLQADDLVRLVAASFGLAYQRVSKAAVLRSLETFFRACAHEGKRVLLIVDEAQGLSRRAIEELRMLSNFQASGRMLMQSFLLGQREFRTTMRSEGFEQLRQRVIAAYHLRPLGPEETAGYIQHRLKTVGWDGSNPRISPAVFEGIHEFAGGVPRRINTLCDRLLLFGGLEELQVIDEAALASVTEDVISEQEPVPEPRLRAPADSAPAPRPESLPPPAAAESANGKSPGQGEADRLAAVESSVSVLADALREELALLRKAVLKRDDGGQD